MTTGKDARMFLSLIYSFATLSTFYILLNYVIPQAMPHAIPQTHSVFYPPTALAHRTDTESDGRHMTSMGVKNKSCEAFLKIVTISFCRKFYDLNGGFTG